VLGAHARTGQLRKPPDGGAEAETQDVASVLAEVIRDAKLRANSAVVAGLPYEKVFFSTLRTELTKRDDVRRLLKFELEDDFPLPFDDLVADVCSHRRVGGDKHEYLIAAASRGWIDARVRTLTGAGRRCSLLSTDACALAAVARLIQPSGESGPKIVLYVDGCRAILAFLPDGVITCARHLSCAGNAETLGAKLAREIELMTRGMLGRQCQDPLPIMLTGSGELARGLSTRLSQATGHEVVCCHSLQVGSPATALDGQFAVALGFALMGLDSPRGEPDFLSADLSHVDRAARAKAKRSALASAVLVVVILALLGLRTFVRLRALGTERVQLAQEIRTVFTQTFPGEKKVVNELAQMTEHLNSLRKEHDTLAAAVGSRIQPLRMLHVLSEKMTSENGISVSALSIRERTARVTGTGGSFESVEQFLNELRQVPDFASVEMEDAALSRGSNRPEFRLVISLKAG
jgi:type II secretory pathway component PulL